MINMQIFSNTAVINIIENFVYNGGNHSMKLSYLEI